VDDDFWTSLQLREGVWADVNVWIADVGNREVLVVTAYPVKVGGSINTRDSRTLYRQTLPRQNYNRKDN
jgi:hypothetical protein